MAATVNLYNHWLTVEGTINDVLDYLSSNNINGKKVLIVLYDGTNYVALVRR